MKIAILSDIHGNMAYLEAAKERIDKEGVTTVICCGDIQEDAVFFELDSWRQKVYLAFGNADFTLKHKLESGTIWAEKLKYFIDFGVVNISGKKIAFCHYDFLARKLAESNKYDIVFYGHTHTPWEEKIDDTILLSPGEITAEYGKPTFAIYDLTKMQAQLIILS